jgi:GNAT superfamily N-acetyltransferase
MSGIVTVLASLPEDAVLRDKVREVLSRPSYQTDRSANDNPWILELFFKVFETLLSVIRWLFDLTEGLPSFLRWVIVAALVVVLVALLVHIFYTLFQALGGERRVAFALEDSSSPLTTAREWEQLADDAAHRGEWIAAVRHLFRACLARLEERERRPFRRGTTNRAHLRRYRNADFFESLELLVVTIERKWYGDEACDVKDYEACRQAHSRLTACIHGGMPC